jgi:hypothetical protein
MPMMQFQNGDGVAVYEHAGYGTVRTATILGPAASEPGKWKVMFQNGDGAIIDIGCIRMVAPGGWDKLDGDDFDDSKIDAWQAEMERWLAEL